MKPFFIGIGAAKAGSTWIYQTLKTHPEIQFGKNKEINFFNDKYSFAYGKTESNYPKGLNWYLKQFEFSKEKKSGEISPAYLWDEKVPGRIKKYFPNIKLICVLRDPIERTYSEYRWIRSGIYIGNHFEEAIKKYPQLTNNSLYYNQLQHFYKEFPRTNILILTLEDIKKNPQKEYNLLCDFLKIKKIKVTLKKSPNATQEIKYPKLNIFINHIQLIKQTKIGRIISQTKPYDLIRISVTKLLSKLNRTTKKPQPVNKNTKRKLKKYFKEDIAQLEKLTKRKYYW